MTSIQTYRVWCDGCSLIYDAQPLATRKLGEVRAMMTAEGWTHESVRAGLNGPPPTLDFCPKCQGPGARDEAIVRFFESIAAKVKDRG